MRFRRAAPLVLSVTLVLAGCSTTSTPAGDTWPLHPDVPVGDAAEVRSVLAQLGIAGSLEPVHVFTNVAPLLIMQVAGDEAIATWLLLRGAVDRTGRWPVVLGVLDNPHDLERIADYSDPPGDLLAQVRDVPWDDWYQQRYEEVVGDLGLPESGREVVPFRRPFEYEAPRDILTGIPYDKVAIALVPTTIPWEVPAHLGWGGWNDNPPAEGHVIAFRHWHEIYGAEVVAMTDIVEMRVALPPASADEALELAREQFVYAYDIVDQGTGDLETLAGWLIDTDGWFFWWD